MSVCRLIILPFGKDFIPFFPSFAPFLFRLSSWPPFLFPSRHLTSQHKRLCWIGDRASISSRSLPPPAQAQAQAQALSCTVLGKLGVPRARRGLHGIDMMVASDGSATRSLLPSLPTSSQETHTLFGNLRRVPCDAKAGCYMQGASSVSRKGTPIFLFTTRE